MPAMTARAYAKGAETMLRRLQTADWDAGNLKCTLHTNSYAVNYDTDQYQSILTNELTTGGGYTAGGLALAGAVVTSTAANSWGQSWVTGTAYTAGQLVRPAAGNGFIYVASNTATSGASFSPGTTLYQTTSDGAVTWCCIGRGAVTLDFNDPSWASFSAGPFRIAVVADTTPGTAATNPLICAFTFAADQTGGGGTFSITVDASGAVAIPY
jgi:hypothetical protein